MARLKDQDKGTSEGLRRAAFEELFLAHYDAVLAYALRRSPVDAHDVAAETFLVAWRRFDSIPDDGLPWLYGVARRTLANRRRSEARRRALEGRLKHEQKASLAFAMPADHFDAETAEL